MKVKNWIALLAITGISVPWHVSAQGLIVDGGINYVISADTNYSNVIVGMLTESNLLSVVNGATLSSNSGMIGGPATQNNAAIVTGTNSTWDIINQLDVGTSGTGSVMTVSDGGRVNVGGQLNIASGNAFNLDSGGMLSSGNLGFDASQAGFNWNDGGHLSVGGTLNGMLVSGGTAALDGLDKTLTIDGGSFMLTNNLTIGAAGSGNTLNIINGGTVNNITGYVGFASASSNNSVLVSGVGSEWSNTSLLAIGGDGDGNSLSILNGGFVGSSNSVIGGSISSTGNVITVMGLGSIYSNQHDLVVGDAGSDNELQIINGGVVYSADTVIGKYETSSNNLLLVAGPSSVLSVRHGLLVGEHGSDNMLVAIAGAQVESSDLVIGVESNSSGNVLLIGGAVVSVDNDLIVGHHGSYNVMGFMNGGRLESQIGVIGGKESSFRNMAMVGSNAVWQVSDGLFVGYHGSTNALFIDGGRVESRIGVIGAESNSDDNLVVVDGPNSMWQVSSNLFVGGRGSYNQIWVEDGARIESERTFLGGFETSSNNVVRVDGTNSTWVNADSFVVGHAGSNNELEILNGARVESGRASIGFHAPASDNEVLVSGLNSTWAITNGLAVGLDGVGNRLTVESGGLVSVGADLLVSSSNSLLLSDGRVEVGNDMIIEEGAIVMGSGSVDFSDVNNTLYLFDDPSSMTGIVFDAKGGMTDSINLGDQDSEYGIADPSMFTNMFVNFEQLDLAGGNDQWNGNAANDVALGVQIIGGSGTNTLSYGDSAAGVMADSSNMGAGLLYQQFQNVILTTNDDVWSVTENDAALTMVDALVGSDMLSYAGYSSITTNALSMGTTNGLYRNFEAVELTAGADTWQMSHNDMELGLAVDGGAGVDLASATHVPHAFTNVSADQLTYLANFEQLELSDLDDSWMVTAGDTNWSSISGADGSDALVYDDTAQNMGAADVDARYVSFEEIDLAGGDDSWKVTSGDTNYNRIAGGAGTDSLAFTDGDDDVDNGALGGTTYEAFEKVDLLGGNDLWTIVNPEFAGVVDGGTGANILGLGYQESYSAADVTGTTATYLNFQTLQLVPSNSVWHINKTADNLLGMNIDGRGINALGVAVAGVYDADTLNLDANEIYQNFTGLGLSTGTDTWLANTATDNSNHMGVAYVTGATGMDTLDWSGSTSAVSMVSSELDGTGFYRSFESLVLTTNDDVYTAIAGGAVLTNLDAGAGMDTLVGGTDNDTFIVSSSSSNTAGSLVGKVDSWQSFELLDGAAGENAMVGDADVYVTGYNSGTLGSIDFNNIGSVTLGDDRYLYVGSGASLASTNIGGAVRMGSGAEVAIDGILASKGAGVSVQANSEVMSIGSISTTGDDAFGIMAGGTSNLVRNMGFVMTAGNDSFGIGVEDRSVIENSGTVSTFGTESHAVSMSGNYNRLDLYGSVAVQVGTDSDAIRVGSAGTDGIPTTGNGNIVNILEGAQVNGRIYNAQTSGSAYLNFGGLGDYGARASGVFDSGIMGWIIPIDTDFNFIMNYDITGSGLSGWKGYSLAGSTMLNGNINEFESMRIRNSTLAISQSMVVATDLDVLSDGTLEIGSGAMITASNYYQNASSILQFGINTNLDGSAKSGQLVVADTAEFDANAGLRWENELADLAFGQSYTNLLVDAGTLIVAGTTNPVNLLELNIDNTLLYVETFVDDNDIWGIIGRRLLSDAAGFDPTDTSSAAGVAREVDERAQQFDTVAQEMLQYISDTGWSSAQINAALRQQYDRGTADFMHGNVLKSAGRQVLSQGQSFQKAQREEPVQPDGVLGPHVADQGLRGWIQGYGSWAKYDNAGGFAGYDMDVYGMVVGLDRSFGDVLFGVAGGYANSDLAQTDYDTSTADTGYGILYASYGTQEWFADLNVSYGQSDIKTTSAAGFNTTGDFSADNYALYAGVGKEITMSDGVLFTPSLALNTSLYDQEAYAEKGLFARSVDAYDRWSCQSIFGASFAMPKVYDTIVIKPEVRAYWLHEFNDESNDVGYSLVGGTGRYTFGTQAPVRDLLEAGLGINARFHDKVELVFDVDGQYSGDYYAYGINGRVKYEF